MNHFLNFKTIRIKMILGFSIVLILNIFLGVYMFWNLNKVNKSSGDIVNRELPLLIADKQLVSALANEIGAVRGYLLFGDGFYKDLFEKYADEGIKQEEIIKEIGATKEFETLSEQSSQWRETIVHDVFQEYDRGNKEGALQNLSESGPFFDEIINGYQDMAKKRENKIVSMEENNIANGERTLTIVSIVIVLVIVLSLIVAFITSYSISKPLRMVMKRMKRIASGDLSYKPIETRSRDEIGQLIAATNEMTKNTKELLNQIMTVSESVSSHSEELMQTTNEVNASSEQIATTMQELASGAESQANSASDLSSIMGSFTVKVRETRENGERIRQASHEVLNMTDRGSQLMESSNGQMEKVNGIVSDAVDKVDGLDKQAQEISKLVSVIQDISDQTNLLALNAAIEAARAGEHGRGFAIVADEVRKLAEQVSVSVTDITDIVERIQSESSIVVDSLKEGYQEVEEGTIQIRTTSETFHTIKTAIKEMAENINIVSMNLSDIANNSEEMNSSIEDVAAISEESAAGVEQTSAASQQTNSSMEEIDGSSRQLATLAENLNGLVQRFKL
ncbi:methyl-accepting chemotaxis protein [Virgibacillus alimentarius]|uniref:methyl-accepting chemotaxis protein n=1 Tax=Virgibacillus alimentarius TaxID=698769 RepID=UPI000493154D|nr:methyl-accepting chemotaxis protein [Virgibacillus alimentarius]